MFSSAPDVAGDTAEVIESNRTRQGHEPVSIDVDVRPGAVSVNLTQMVSEVVVEELLAAACRKRDASRASDPLPGSPLRRGWRPRHRGSSPVRKLRASAHDFDILADVIANFPTLHEDITKKRDSMS